MTPVSQGRFGRLVKADGARIVSLAAAKHRLGVPGNRGSCMSRLKVESWYPFPDFRYESFRLPLGRSVRHFTALMLVAEQISMERSAKALTASTNNTGPTKD